MLCRVNAMLSFPLQASAVQLSLHVLLGQHKYTHEMAIYNQPIELLAAQATLSTYHIHFFTHLMGGVHDSTHGTHLAAVWLTLDHCWPQ